MGKTHKEQQELVQELAATFGKIKVGGMYQHYKGADKLYKVAGLAFLEATDELCVIYQSLYGQRLTFVRPLSSWLEMVEWEGGTLPRFKLLDY